MKHEQYKRAGFLALDPKAFLELFVVEADRSNSTLGDVTVVDISGPLEHRESGWFDSYEAISNRFSLACASPGSSTIVLRIDSPGGCVSGMLECAQSLKAKAKAAGKRLIAYVDGSACSAAYALASVADEIIVPSTGFVGSIGVISTRVDFSKADEATGVRVALITSGARKADGHPSMAISDEELASTQGQIDSLAAVFFEHVSAHRKLSADQVKALEAGIFHGANAVKAGLADRVLSLNELLADLASVKSVGDTMSDKYEEALAALQSAAESEDEEVSKKAKAALAAIKGETSEEEEQTDASDDSEEESEEEKKKDDALAASVATRLAALEAHAVKVLLDARNDLGKDAKALLAGKPVAEVQAFLAALPRNVPQPAAGAVVGGTRGATQVDKDARHASTDEEIEAIDRAMGLGSKAIAGKGETKDNRWYMGRAPRDSE